LEALAPWKSANAFRHVSERALRLAHRKETELPETVTRNRREKIRIAAFCVEHRHVGRTLHDTAARRLDEFVLQLERAERCKTRLGHVCMRDAAILFCH